MPEHEPHDGHAEFSQSRSSSSDMFPAACLPTASNIEERDMPRLSPPFTWPASIGPPDTNIEGRSRRAAAISMPGTILSQLGMKTRASNGCAVAMTSIESAISSLEASEYFMPVWPMAMPSHTPMTGNITGLPPFSLTPALTASAIFSSSVWPGMISLNAATTPIVGMAISLSVQPSAFISDLWGAFCTPAFIESDLIWPSSLLSHRRRLPCRYSCRLPRYQPSSRHRQGPC